MKLRVLIFGLFFNFCLLSFGAVIPVTNMVDDPTAMGSLRYAINNSQPGDVIELDFPASTTLVLEQGELTIPHSLTIKSKNGEVSIDAGNSNRIFIVNSPSDPTHLTIENINFLNGNVTVEGGAILFNSQGNLIIRNCDFTENFAQNGGAIYFKGNDLTISHCFFYENEASNGSFGFKGGAVYAEINKVGTIKNSSFQYNSAKQTGGALYLSSSSGEAVKVQNCTMVENNSSTNGGAVYLQAGMYSFIHNSILDNIATTDGAGVYTETGATVAFSNNLFKNSPKNLKNNGTATSNGGNLIDNGTGFPYNQLDKRGYVNSLLDLGLETALSTGTFVSVRKLLNTSIARDFAVADHTLPTDANNNSRLGQPSDAGAVEYGQGLTSLTSILPTVTKTCGKTEVIFQGNLPTGMTGKWILPSDIYIAPVNVNNNPLTINLYNDKSFEAIWRLENSSGQVQFQTLPVNYSYFEFSSLFTDEIHTICKPEATINISYMITGTYNWSASPLSGSVGNATVEIPYDVNLELEDVGAGYQEFLVTVTNGHCTLKDTAKVERLVPVPHPVYGAQKIITVNSIVLNNSQHTNSGDGVWTNLEQFPSTVIAPIITVNSFGLPNSTVSNLTTECARYTVQLKNNTTDNCPAYVLDIIRKPTTGECLEINRHGTDAWCSKDTKTLEVVTTQSAPYHWSSPNPKVTFTNPQGKKTKIKTNGALGNVIVNFTDAGSAKQVTYEVFHQPFLDLGDDLVVNISKVILRPKDTTKIGDAFDWYVNGINGGSGIVVLNTIDREATITTLNPKNNVIRRDYEVTNTDGTRCSTKDSINVFYETDISQNLDTTSHTLVVDNSGQLIIDVERILREKTNYPGDFSMFSIKRHIKSDKVHVEQIGNTPYLRLTYAKKSDISLSDYVEVETCSQNKNACYNLRVYLRERLTDAKIIVYNAVSPNNDEMNDYLHLANVEYFENISVMVFTRAGNIVWLSDKNGGSYNNETVRWDGLDNDGEKLLDGTYYYIVRYQNSEQNGGGKKKTLKGFLELRF